MKLTIPEPCSQKWEQMAFLDDNTKFCSKCSNNIIDFTSQSDKEILKYFNTNTSAICGKLSPNQLDRTVANSEKKFPGLKAILLAGALTSLSSEVHSQVPETKVEMHQAVEINDTFQIIRGTIQDTSSNPGNRELLLELLGFDLYCSPDSMGNFQFNLPAKDFPDSIAIIVRKGNAYKVFKVLNPNEFIQIEVALYPIDIDVNFIKETQIIGLIIVKPKWYQFRLKFRRFWYRLWN